MAGKIDGNAGREAEADLRRDLADPGRARVEPGILGDVREEHAPGRVGHLAPEFAVDEVAQPARGVAQGRRYRDDVDPAEPVRALHAAVDQRGDDHADEASVVRESLEARVASLAEGP